jgi:hypothetical protein
MSLPRPNICPGNKLLNCRSCRKDHRTRREFFTGFRSNARIGHPDRASIQKQIPAIIYRSLNEVLGRTRRIANAIRCHQQRTSQSGSQIRFGFGQLRRIQNLNWNPTFMIKAKFALHFGEFFGIGSDPERSAPPILGIRGQLFSYFSPQALRETRQGKLRLGIVHYGEVSHAGPGCSTANVIACFKDRDL